MSKHQNVPHFDSFLNWIYKVLTYLRCFISITIIIAIIITMWSVPQQILRCADVESNSLIDFLEYIINIIIAAELIQVLLHQSLGTIVEILTLALTRELILKQLPTEEFLIGIIGVAVLFAIRKFLFVKIPDRSDDNHSTSDTVATDDYKLNLSDVRKSAADFLNRIAGIIDRSSTREDKVNEMISDKDVNASVPNTDDSSYSGSAVDKDSTEQTDTDSQTAGSDSDTDPAA